MSSFSATDGRMDPSRVRNAVRDAVRRRREEPATPAEQAVAQRLVEMAAGSEVDPELLTHLLAADGRWNVSPDYRIDRRSRGFGAGAVVSAQRLIRPLIRFYTDPVIVRQVQVNLFLLHAVRTLLAEVTRLQRAVAALGEPLDGPAAGRESGVPRP